MSAEVTFTREELYARVWAEPIDRLARQFGISNVGLGKLCRRHQIPVPGRGYWARRAAGQRVVRPPLPRVARSGDPYSITIQGTRMPQTNSPTADSPHPFAARESQPDYAIAVPHTLPLTAPLVTRTVELLGKAKPDSSGRTPIPKGALHLFCSSEQRDRGLRIWQALISAFARRDYAINQASDKTTVVVLDESLEVSLEEGTKSVPHVPSEAEQRKAMRTRHWATPTHDEIPNGTLTLSVTNVSSTRQRWSDSRAPLEQQLNQFLRGLVRAALTLKSQRNERARLERAHQEEQQRQQEARRHRQVRKFQAAQLDALLAGWNRAEELQRMLSAYRARIDSATDDVLDAWLVKMEGHVAKVHPVHRLEPQRILSLVHVSYGAAKILDEGFSESLASPWDRDEPPPGILLETHYDHGREGVLVTILERVVLPYELVKPGSTHRQFYVPAETLNRHAKVAALR